MASDPRTSPTRQDIEAALADPNPHNQLAKQVAAAIVAYANHFQEAVERQGGFDQPIRLPEPRDTVESKAFELFMAELRKSAPGARVLAVHQREQP
jgi:hypothetical protein